MKTLRSELELHSGKYFVINKGAQKSPLFSRHPPKLLSLLTFSYDVQHHSKRCESSDHVEERYSVLNGETLFSCPVVETTDQQ